MEILGPPPLRFHIMLLMKIKHSNLLAVESSWAISRVEFITSDLDGCGEWQDCPLHLALGAWRPCQRARERNHFSFAFMFGDSSVTWSFCPDYVCFFPHSPGVLYIKWFVSCVSFFGLVFVNVFPSVLCICCLTWLFLDASCRFFFFPLCLHRSNSLQYFCP